MDGQVIAWSLHAKMFRIASSTTLSINPAVDHLNTKKFYRFFFQKGDKVVSVKVL